MNNDIQGINEAYISRRKPSDFAGFATPTLTPSAEKLARIRQAQEPPYDPKDSVKQRAHDLKQAIEMLHRVAPRTNSVIQATIAIERAFERLLQSI